MDFNLLPQEYAPKKPKVYINVLVGVYVILLLTLIIYIKNVSDSNSIKGENVINMKKDEEKAEAEKIKISKSMEADVAYNLFSTNREKLQQVMNGLDFDYEKLLLFLSDITPQEVSIQKIESQEGTLLIEGQTDSYEVFMAFYQRIKDANIFYDAKLSTFEIKLDQKVMVYKIECKTQRQVQVKTEAEIKTEEQSKK